MFRKYASQYIYGLLVQYLPHLGLNLGFLQAGLDVLEVLEVLDVLEVLVRRSSDL